MTRMWRISTDCFQSLICINPPHPRHSHCITPCLLTFDFREAVESDAGAQTFDHASRDNEKRLWQIIEVVPIPAVALFRLRQLRLAGGRFANEIDIDVMPLAESNFKSVIPSPVSSRTSRRAACSKLSPNSMWPPGAA
jgi:hypothetical protein